MHSPEVTPDTMRASLRRTAATACVLLAHDGVEVRAATITSWLAITLEPPTLLVSLGLARRVHAPLVVGSRCSLNVLASDQTHIGDHFASRVGLASGVNPVRLGRHDDVPVVPEALVTWITRVEDMSRVGDHSLIRLFVTDVLERSGDEDAPVDPAVWCASGWSDLDEATRARVGD
jgi:flavin reductase (DIM6/NTAB) family NADH-FMN oxidoreductase RutF